MCGVHNFSLMTLSSFEHLNNVIKLNESFEKVPWASWNEIDILNHIKIENWIRVFIVDVTNSNLSDYLLCGAIQFRVQWVCGLNIWIICLRGKLSITTRTSIWSFLCHNYLKVKKAVYWCVNMCQFLWSIWRSTLNFRNSRLQHEITKVQHSFFNCIKFSKSFLHTNVNNLGHALIFC